MLLSLNELRGYQIQAKDDTLGKADDFFFDDHDWSVRYLIVSIGWLLGRDVLIAPKSIEKIDPAGEKISVSLTKNQIEQSPGVDCDLPVSRQEELALHEHYGWPKYWEGYPAGTALAPLIPPLPPENTAETPGTAAAASAESDLLERYDPNLRSAKEVEGYHIEAIDGEMGHVEDLMVDPNDWIVRYLIIDTRNWLPGRKVIVAPGWAEGIDWAERQVHMKLNRETIENSPPYDPKQPIDRDYEKAIYDHYSHMPYWA